MADKKIVDDYYSTVASWEGSDSSSEWEKKIKIKPKRKIVIKKPTEKAPISDKEIITVDKWEKKELKKPFIKKAYSSKNVVQTMTVVKREPIKVVRRSERKPTENKPYEKKNTSSSAAPFKTSWTSQNTETWEKKNDFKWNKFKKTHFKAGKTWPNDKKEEGDKKSTLWGGYKKTRWRFQYWREKEVTFTRSNKIAKKKKEEKNIDEITQDLVDRKWQIVTVSDFLTLKEFSEKIWIVLPRLMAEFMKNGMMVNINSKIDFDSASIVAESFEVIIERDNSEWVKVEDILEWNLSELLSEDDDSKLKPRSPVISIMWHVDHGKTSLLDYIRESKVTAGEAGWITQSIWAYQVNHGDHKITFLDTPWHEAFTIMRARWAKSTDIAILVVAADEWVKPQTIESINHAKEADIPVIVAINKMDKEWANPDHVKWQLAEHWLTPEDWGGDTPMVPVSAHTWFWIDELLEIILLVAEMKELKANPDRAWIATVIEAHLDHKLWPVATVLMNAWILSKWDNVVCHDSFWKIKILKDYASKNIKSVWPSEPVLIVWLDKVVEGWAILQVVESQELARKKATEYKSIISNRKKAGESSLDLLMSKIKAWNLKQLKIVLKADTNGALEAIKGALTKLSTPETTVSIIHSWVWTITEGDILMSEWSQAILIWFNVGLLPNAKSLIQSSWVEHLNSNIIYHITERIEKIVSWMLDPREVEISLGYARVWWIFFTDKKFMVIWLKLKEFKDDGELNKIQKWAKVRVIRKKKMIWTWKIESLKQWMLDVKELEWPIECWIKFVWNLRIEEWDELEIYKIEIHK